MMDIVVGSTPKKLRSEYSAGTLMGNQAHFPSRCGQAYNGKVGPLRAGARS